MKHSPDAMRNASIADLMACVHDAVVHWRSHAIIIELCVTAYHAGVSWRAIEATILDAKRERERGAA